MLRTLLLISFCTAFWAGAQKHFLGLEVNGGNSLEIRRTTSQSHGVISLSPEVKKVREPMFGFGVGYGYYGDLFAFKSKFSFRNSKVITSYSGGRLYKHFLYSQIIAFNINGAYKDTFLGPIVSLGAADMYQRSIYNFFLPGIGLLFRKNKLELSYKYEYRRNIPFFWAEYCNDNECHLSFSQISFSYLFALQKKK